MTASRNVVESQNEYIEKVKLSTYFDKSKDIYQTVTKFMLSQSDISR